MYQGAVREQKRQRLAPPNEVWLDAIMSKSKAAASRYRDQRPMDSEPKRQPSLRSPLEVEEMLREQANLDDIVLREAFAMAMEELVPPQECSFVAKGLCHLCGVDGNHYVPVVNFCPHAQEGHSLCREHLRSVYGVRVEELFSAKDPVAAGRCAMRCMVCSKSCPCSMCAQNKQEELTRYKRFLIAELRRAHNQITAMKEQRATAMTKNDGRMTYDGRDTASSDSRRYDEYMPTEPPAAGRGRPRKEEEYGSHSVEKDDRWEERRRLQMQSNYEQYPVNGQQNGRDSYPSELQAEQKIPARAPLAPKRAAKDVSGGMLSMIADSAQTSDVRAAARGNSPHVHQGSVESPSAAHVMNCAESEQSLVRLLSSLNQDASPSNKADPQNERSRANGIARKESARGEGGEGGYDQDSSNAGYDTGSPRADSARPAEGNRRADHDDISDKDDESYEEDESSTSSVESNSIRGRAAGAARKVEGLAEAVARKRKADERDRASSSSADQNKHNNSGVVEKRKRGRPRKMAATESSAPSGPGSVRENNLSSHSGKKKRRGRPPTRKHGAHRTKSARRKGSSGEEDGYEEETEDEGMDEADREDGSDSELDTNLDYCEVCQGAGDLVCCDKCPRSFHLACLNMKESDLPEGDWQCAECKKPSRFDSYSSAVAAESSLLDKCLKIVECLKSHPFAKPFLAPVENVPLYTRVVKQPMDLSTIETKLKKGAYVMESKSAVAGVKELNVDRFADDIRLMWSNCKLFNDDGSGITRAADQLSSGFERLLNESTQSAGHE